MSRARGLLRRAGDERGQSLPLVALAMVVLLGFGALAIDVANARLHKARLQTAVDLALVTGAQKLPNSAVAGGDATAYAKRNWAQLDGSVATTTVTTGCRVSGCPQPDKITLSATAEVPSSLAKLFGIDHWTVHAKGSACGPCETSINKFDVVVVLDRSYSMCLNSSGSNNNCYDLQQAVAGIQNLLGFFNPTYDRLALTVLSSGDSKSPFAHSGSAYPCDTSATDTTSGKGAYYSTLGDFMDGTPANHDSWVLAPLASDFKKADGSLNASSAFVTALNCVKHKYWTPIAPAISEATDQLLNNPRTGAKKIIVFMGDGGGNVQPMKRNANGDSTTTQSWYTPTAGNNMKPCHDAVAQAARAKANNIEVFTIGYDLNASGANACITGNYMSGSAVESGIDGRSTIQQMATNTGHFYEKATPGEVYSIFQAIGRQITSGGVRLID